MLTIAEEIAVLKAPWRRIVRVCAELSLDLPPVFRGDVARFDCDLAAWHRAHQTDEACGAALAPSSAGPVPSAPAERLPSAPERRAGGTISSQASADGGQSLGELLDTTATAIAVASRSAVRALIYVGARTVFLSWRTRS